MSALDSAVQEAGRLEVQLENSQRRLQATRNRLQAIQQELEITETQLKIDEQQVNADLHMLEAARAHVRLEELRLSADTAPNRGDEASTPAATTTAEATATTEATAPTEWVDGNGLLKRLFQEHGADHVTFEITAVNGEGIPAHLPRAPENAPEQVIATVQANLFP
ncbi:unnamed protein product [Fusarium equiseti]|uniref:Uncharacterized protein n=1 Tax=Fusarium equiseti TaxID=61235 RepID=A0A8J2IEJ4_FUSEQ|nr:unnamed protein product [Fusarium equiseti]